MCSEQYVFSNRGHRLSTRLTLPKQPEHTLGYVIYIHEYGAHSNHPHVQTMAKQLHEANYGMITFDFHGHGYSTILACHGRRNAPSISLSIHGRSFLYERACLSCNDSCSRSFCFLCATSHYLHYAHHLPSGVCRKLQALLNKNLSAYGVNEHATYLRVI